MTVFQCCEAQTPFTSMMKAEICVNESYPICMMNIMSDFFSLCLFVMGEQTSNATQLSLMRKRDSEM